MPLTGVDRPAPSSGKTLARPLVLNGKFLRAPMTGVHRVAMELGNALADLAAKGHPAIADYDPVVWYPHDGATAAADVRLPGRMLSPLTSIPWEQLTLPLAKGESLLLNLCNIGPVLARDCVTMIHDVQVHLSPQSYGRGFRLWYHLVQPAFSRRHRMLLTVSEFSRQEIARVGLAPLERIHVVPNGVDHMLRVVSDPGIVERLGLTPGRYAVALSTTQAHKNIGLLLRSFALPELADLTLVLVGGTDRAAFVAAGHEVPGNVLFAGRVSDEALRGLFEQALALAFPSTTEGFGLPPLEAMLLGCPALIAPCGALPEVCGDAAQQLPPDDPVAWATALSQLAGDPLSREHWSMLGRARAQEFTWEASALCLLQALNAMNRRATGRH